MPRLTALLTRAALLCAATTAVGQPPGALYKWVDAQGVVHYGDHVPPQYSQQSAAILNKEGVVVGEVSAPKSEAQLAQEASARAAAARQKQHDAFLLGTYTSVKDIEALRDERLDQIHGQQVAAQQYVNTLHERLATLQAREQNFKPFNTRADARPLPEDLAQQVAHTQNDIRTQRAALAASQQDEVRVRQQFQADIDRYQQLRGGSSGQH